MDAVCCCCCWWWWWFAFGYSVQFLRVRSVIHPRLRQKLSKRGIMSAMGLWENHRLHHFASTMPRTRALVPGVVEDSAYRACSGVEFGLLTWWNLPG